MWKPKVSVIVPVYNTEKYLRKCLDSLADQTLKDMEIIIVNDGSKDSSPMIIKEYTDRYPERFISLTQENSGQAVARNAALKICKGDYVGFLDSDDYVRKDMFGRMYNTAISEKADYVACGFSEVTYDQTGEEVALKHYVCSKPAYSCKDMFFEAYASPWLHLYKKEVLEKSGADFPQGVVYEDTAFYLNLIPYVTKLAVIEEPLVYHVKHSRSTMATFKAAKVKQIFPVIDYSLDFYKKNGWYEKYRNELEYFCVRVLLCSSMQRICKVADRRERKVLIKETLEYIKKNFSTFRKNRYFKGGVKHLYLRSFNRFTAPIYTWAMRIKGRFERNYI